MYLKDMLERMVRRSNIPVLCYLVLNVVIIAGVTNWFLSGFDMPLWQSLPAGVILYAGSLLIALSPVGEWILRLQTGCRKMKNEEQLQFIMPIFNEVYDKARRLDPSIPEDVQLYINDSESPNAFATGRKTICITKGMFFMPQEQIKAALGHEFGHLAHKDTDLILMISVGNLIISAFILIFKLVIGLFHLIFEIMCIPFGGTEGLITSIINAIIHAITLAVVSGLTWLWTMLGVVLVLKSSRANEFEADAFSFELGYGDELCALLNGICAPNEKGLFANLVSSHPDKNDRIAKLQELGAVYNL